MTYFLIAALLGLIPAFIAKSKGRNMFGWWIYGVLLWIVALIHVLCVSDLNQELAREQASQAQKELRECPYCAELIKRKASKCKHCGATVTPIPEKEPEPLPKTWEEIKAQHGVKPPDIKGAAKGFLSATTFGIIAIIVVLGIMILVAYLQKVTA